MEQRRQKTRTRTLSWFRVGGQFILVLLLFTPAFIAFQDSPLEHQVNLTSHRTLQLETIESVRPDDLVKIFSVIKSRRPDISDGEAWRVSEVILEESIKRHLDPMMVLAVIQVESGFQYTTVSPMGARGIMQIMPETGRFLTENLSDEFGIQPASFRPESLDDPLFNIRLGVYYLHDLAKQFRSLNLALLAYNAGPAEIQNRLENNIAVSDEYATQIFDAYHNFKNFRPPAF